MTNIVASNLIIFAPLPGGTICAIIGVNPRLILLLPDLYDVGLSFDTKLDNLSTFICSLYRRLRFLELAPSNAYEADEKASMDFDKLLCNNNVSNNCPR